VALIFWRECARLTMSRHVVWGAELTMVSVLLASLGTIAAAACHREGVSGWGPLAWAMSYGSAGAFLFALATGAPWNWSWSASFIGSLLYLALFGSIVAFGAYIALVRRVGPAKAGYIGVLTPVVALVVSSAWEGFVWTGLTVAGIALAIAGNVIALWPATAAEGR
jgi:drug/metabolite transporter (DMT)-like permease